MLCIETNVVLYRCNVYNCIQWFYSLRPLVTCSSLPSRSHSVVILNDMYTSSDSFVSSRDLLCSSLSELNRRASSGLLERHYRGDSQSQDPNDYRIIEIEMGMFSPSGPKAKSVACLRGLAEEEGDRSVVMAPPKDPNWVLLHPSSVELLKTNRKEKARSMDELAPKRLKRVVHFEDNSTLHSSHLTSSTNCDRAEMLKPHLHSNVSLMRRRSLDDIIDLTQYGESRGIPHSHSYATLDVIPEDVAFLDNNTLHDDNTLHDNNSLHDENSLHDDNSLHLGSSTESGGLHVLNNTNNEVDVSMETTETIAMVSDNGISDDEAIHGASSTEDSCNNLLQPGPLVAGRTSCAVHSVGTQETSFEDGFFPQNAAQSSENEQSVVECQQERSATGILQDTYQDMMAEGEEENDASSVSQTSMERTPPLIKVSFIIIEEAERKVVKDPSPVSVEGLRGDFVPMPRLPQHNQGPVQSHDTASHTGGSPGVAENPPLNTSAASAEDHRDDHNSQTADGKGMLDRNRVHIIREIFLKHPQAEGEQGRCPQPALDRGPQRRKSREVLVNRWPQLLEEERRWVDGDDDLLLCASVPTLDLTDSQIEGQSTSDSNLNASHQAVKVYSGSEEFTDGQTPSQPPVDAGSSVKQDWESFDWFSGVVTETLQFQMDRQDDATSDFGGGGSHFELGDNSNTDDSTSDSTDSDDDGFVRPSIVSGLDLVSMTPPPRYPTLNSIINYNQMYLPTSVGTPKSAGDSQVSLERRKVSTKPRMSIIQEEEEAIEKLVRRM